MPKDIPAARFWSLTLYDNQNRSMLQTPQRHPRAGSQSYLSSAAEAEPERSTVLYVSPTRPDDVAPGNWIQTDPDKGWCTLLRLYSPLPAFFDKTWNALSAAVAFGTAADPSSQSRSRACRRAPGWMGP